MKQYPLETARAEGPGSDRPLPASPPKPARRRKVLTQIILPVVILLVVVVGITFVAQYGLHRENKPEGPPKKVVPLDFPLKTAVWDGMEPAYMAEFESHKENGHYHFLFGNRNQGGAELGFVTKSCRCAKVEVGRLTGAEARALTAPLAHLEFLTPQCTILDPVGSVLRTAMGPLSRGGMLHLINRDFRASGGLRRFLKRELSWEELTEEKHKDQGIVVDPGSAGLIRLSWKTSERDEDRIRLTLDLWTEMLDSRKPREKIKLAAGVGFVPPVRTFPDNLEINDWVDGVARREFKCWSSTRPRFALTAHEPNDDPCVKTEVIPLTEDECHQLQTEIWEGNHYSTRVRCGYRVKIVVRQVQGAHQLEQGHFVRWVELASKEVPAIPGVKVSGYVPGDVTVEGEKSRGMVTLGNFPKNRGKTAVVFLRTNAGVELLPDEVDKNPKFMKVKLTKEKAGSNRWKLALVVPPDPPGRWPKDSAIVLHARQADQPKRRIRIPIIANPFQ